MIGYVSLAGLACARCRRAVSFRGRPRKTENRHDQKQQAADEGPGSPVALALPCRDLAADIGDNRVERIEGIGLVDGHLPVDLRRARPVLQQSAGEVD